ncbi:hypothetical protein BC827DRAFT_1254128 [Russula dissimulans]|nr:hypothetical protein BC827DRAFT_1254128 [Russula dissimulans]
MLTRLCVIPVPCSASTPRSLRLLKLLLGAPPPSLLPLLIHVSSPLCLFSCRCTFSLPPPGLVAMVFVRARFSCFILLSAAFFLVAA